MSSFCMNSRPHTSIKTREKIASFGWKTLPYPPFSPDLAPSDYYFFGPMKEDLRIKNDSSDEEVKSVVKKWLKEESREFYRAGIHALIQRWNIAIERNIEGCDSQRTSFILMYNTCSCVGNYTCPKQNGITF